MGIAPVLCADSDRTTLITPIDVYFQVAVPCALLWKDISQGHQYRSKAGVEHTAFNSVAFSVGSDLHATPDIC